MKVKDIMTEPVLVSKSDRLSHAMELMEKHDTRRLLVVNGNDIMGVITMRSLTRQLGTWKKSNLPATSLHVATATTSLFAKVPPDTSIENGIEIMDRTGGILVVATDSDILGWVTPNEILKNVQVAGGFAAEIMKEPISIGVNERVAHARRLMLDNDIGRLPVLENGELVGIITEKDVAKGMRNFRWLVPDNQQDDRIRRLIVRDIMTRNVKFVRTNTPVSEVVSLILHENIGGVPVLNLRDELAGVISRRGVIRHLSLMCKKD